ncbi:MAG: flagellar biosynthesis protein FlhB [Desulfurobacterium sp.]|nr:MAG: flagellar biosynthesis protein FlhB [Desulfurobacterium sp.]
MGDIKKAVALKYNLEVDNAPKLIAKAKGEKEIAEKIIKIAKENGIPIYEDPYLISILYKLDFYEEIPEEVYEAVAAILATIYKATKK